MNEPTDAIEDMAYTVIFISCQVAGCHEMYEPCISEPMTEPIEIWAKDIAQRAKEAGWASHKDGRVLCPLHFHINR